ncbi:MAG: hypothetical protein OXG87_19145 [Gemmatimonadetes bacterium]|nr:hypothetical protein [Gemmatimonadota bacterium]
MNKTNWMNRYDEIYNDVRDELQEYGDDYADNNAHDITIERIQKLQEAEDGYWESLTAQPNTDVMDDAGKE